MKIALGIVALLLTGCATTEPVEKVTWWNLDSCLNATSPKAIWRRGDGTILAIPRSTCVAIKAASTKIEARADKKLWRIFIVDLDSVNAFASFQYSVDPYVALHVGMVRALGADEDAWAGLMGHEIAHLVRRHDRGRAEAETGARVAGNVLANIVSYAVPGAGGAVAGTVVGTVTVNAMYGNYTRPQEAEADELGLKWMTEAGYDPRGLMRLFEILGRQASLPVFVSTHPGAEDRAQRVQAYISRTRAP